MLPSELCPDLEPRHIFQGRNTALGQVTMKSSVAPIVIPPVIAIEVPIASLDIDYAQPPPAVFAADIKVPGRLKDTASVKSLAGVSEKYI